MPILTPKDLIDSGEELFSLPKLYFELQEALEDPDKTFQDIGTIISSDPALCARLLKLVNSAFYGFPQKIETITHALSIIGMDQLSDLALATTVIYQFRGIPNSLYNMEKFWRHSVACGLAAKCLARLREEECVERYYLAGILHDIGRLVVFKKEPHLARDAYYLSQAEKENIYMSERALMGFDHADIGGELLRRWNLPPRLASAVMYHHRPEQAQEFRVEATLVHVADYLVHTLGIGSDADFSEPEMETDHWQVIGVDPQNQEFIGVQVDMQFEAIARIFF